MGMEVKLQMMLTFAEPGGAVQRRFMGKTRSCSSVQVVDDLLRDLLDSGWCPPRRKQPVPPPPPVEKSCSSCSSKFFRPGFATRQWPRPRPECRNCTAASQSEARKAKSARQRRAEAAREAFVPPEPKPNHEVLPRPRAFEPPAPRPAAAAAPARPDKADSLDDEDEVKPWGREDLEHACTTGCTRCTVRGGCPNQSLWRCELHECWAASFRRARASHSWQKCAALLLKKKATHCLRVRAEPSFEAEATCMLRDGAKFWVSARLTLGDTTWGYASTPWWQGWLVLNYCERADLPHSTRYGR